MVIPDGHFEVVTKACISTFVKSPRLSSRLGSGLCQTLAPCLFLPAILDSYHQVSPSHQHRKAASFQNLHSLLSGKGDRSSLYVVGESGDHSAAGG